MSAPPLTTLILTISLLSNFYPLHRAHLVSCPCSLVVKAPTGASQFQLSTLPVSRPRPDHNLPQLTASTSPLNQQNGDKYFRVQIQHHGIFNLTLTSPASQILGASRPLGITSATRTKRSTENACPVLLPQDPPIRFETLRSKPSRHLPKRTRIVGGVEAGPQISQYVVLVKPHPDTWDSACSGTLVGPSTVITAAHCGVNSESSVYFGFVDKQTNPGVKRSVSSHLTHPQFGINPHNGLSSYDVTYITLSEPAPSSAKAMKLNWNPSIPLSKTVVRVAGYGRLEKSGPIPQTLHQVDMKVLSSAECINYYNKGKKGIDINQVFCSMTLGGVDCSPCQADSGGPIWQYDEEDNPVLIGIVSRGEKCSTKSIPSLSVRASSSYIISPDEVMWANNTAALTVNGDSANASMTAAPSPSFAPLPNQSPSTSSSTGVDDSKIGSSTSIITIVFGSLAGVLLFGAVAIIVVSLARR